MPSPTRILSMKIVDAVLKNMKGQELTTALNVMEPEDYADVVEELEGVVENILEDQKR